MSIRRRLRNLLPRKRRKKNGGRNGDTKKSTGKGTGGARPKRVGGLPAYPSYRKKPRPSRFKRYLKRAFWYGSGVFALLLAWAYITLPNIDDLNKFSKTPSILIKSEDGQIIGSFGDIYGEYIPFDELPASLGDALIATEDRNYYHHFGVDPLGLLRAAFVDIRARHVVQGGSTITQQVAKNVFLTSERSFTRKLKEMMLAIKLERRFSKHDILSIYLNRVYFGAGSYGIDAAAHRYFDKSARDLTLSESAIMAGLLKAPSRFAPTSNPQLSRKRAEQVLLNMEDAKYLNKAQTTRAIAELNKSMSGRKRSPQSAMYFADWIMDQIPNYIGTVQQDLVVTTTLRPDLQMLAEKAIKDVMDKDGEKHEASQAALLSMTPDGAVRALIGGRSYGESQYNRATQALRQPGSSFKIFVYLAGLEDGLTPDTMVNDQPLSIPIYGGTWHPKNYGGKYLGEIPLKEAVTQSINTVAVQVAQRVGTQRVINMAHRLGVTADLDPVPSIALGATEVSLLDMTTAYAHLAADGAIVSPYGIVEIDTTKGDKVYERHPTDRGRALSPGIVGMMNEMLESVVQNGTGKGARIGRPVAGKTGTTSDYRDAWFMGFTPDLATGVWVGNDDNTPMKKVTGGMMPASIWHDYMMAALAKTPIRDIPTSGNVTAPLPWQDGSAPAFPQQPGSMQHGQKPADADRVKLGNSFWDKLMR